MVSTASPEEEGTRNDRIVWKTSITLMNSTLPNPASVPASAFRMVSVILPASIITTMPRATPMISATPSRSRAPFTKVSTKVRSSIFVEPSNFATKKVTIAMPRNSADICPIHQPLAITPAEHDHEGQPEEREDHLAHPVERRQRRAELGALEEVRDVVLALRRDHRARRLRLYPLRVAHDKEDAGREAGEEDEHPQQQPVGEGHAGRVRGDHRGEGVEGRAQRADAGSRA